MTANSAPTKKALPSSSRSESHRAAAGLIERPPGLVPSASRVAIASASWSGAAGTGEGRNRSRSTRRPSIASTRTRQPGSVHLVTDDRHPAEAGHDEAADRLVGGPVGDLGAEPVADLVGAPQPGHRPGAVGPRPRPVVRPRSCSSLTSPTISSMTSSRVTTPGRAAVLVDDDGQLEAAPRAACSSSGSSRIVSGTRGRVDHQGRHRHVVAPLVRHRHRPLDVDESVDVVPVLADDREAGVAGAPCQPEHVAGRGGALDRRAAHARAHHVGGRALAEVERARHEPRGALRRGCPPRPTAGPARRAPAGVRAPEQLLLRVDADRAQHEVGRAVEHDDERPGEDREEAHRERDDPGGRAAVRRCRGTGAAARRRPSRRRSR